MTMCYQMNLNILKLIQSKLKILYLYQENRSYSELWSHPLIYLPLQKYSQVLHYLKSSRNYHQLLQNCYRHYHQLVFLTINKLISKNHSYSHFNTLQCRYMLKIRLFCRYYFYKFCSFKSHHFSIISTNFYHKDSINYYMYILISQDKYHNRNNCNSYNQLNKRNNLLLIYIKYIIMGIIDRYYYHQGNVVQGKFIHTLC